MGEGRGKLEESAEFEKWRSKDYVRMNGEEDYVQNEDENRKGEMKITGLFDVKPSCLADGYTHFGGVSKLTALRTSTASETKNTLRRYNNSDKEKEYDLL
jgi:hypothetical protein